MGHGGAAGDLRLRCEEGRLGGVRGAGRTPAAEAPGAPAARRAARSGRRSPPARAPGRTAADLARQQRDISVSEFFAKNRHLLGFDNPSKALLDHREGGRRQRARRLRGGGDPARRARRDRASSTRRASGSRSRTTGRASCAPRCRRSSGGCSTARSSTACARAAASRASASARPACTGCSPPASPIVITTRTGAKQPAHHFELVIDTKTQRAEGAARRRGGLGEGPRHAGRDRARGRLARRPALGRRLPAPDLAREPARRASTTCRRRPEGAGEPIEFPRVTDELPPETAEIKPHPYGVELGVLMQMLRDTAGAQPDGLPARATSRASRRASPRRSARRRASRPRGGPRR